MRIPAALAAAAITALSGDFDRATAMITVAAGAHAGTFLVRNSESPCEITQQKAPRPKHQFEVSIGGVKAQMDPSTLTQLMLIIPNADVRGPVHSFFKHGAQASVDFDLKTADGVQFKGVIQCSPPIRD